jgi:hypothetical protein
MTKHPKAEVNEKVLKNFLPQLTKDQITTLMLETLTKEDLIQAIIFTWNQRNLTTNDRLEKYFNRNFKHETNF